MHSFARIQNYPTKHAPANDNCLLHLTSSLDLETNSGALRTSAYTYDTKGNMLTRTVNDVSSYALPARTWTYTYDATGLPLTALDPVGNTTTFTYTNGSLATITDPLSHVTTFSNFTAGGRPQTITDINGVVPTPSPMTRASASPPPRLPWAAHRRPRLTTGRSATARPRAASAR